MDKTDKEATLRVLPANHANQRLVLVIRAHIPFLTKFDEFDCARKLLTLVSFL
jgi:hypothetical protein